MSPLLKPCVVETLLPEARLGFEAFLGRQGPPYPRVEDDQTVLKVQSYSKVVLQIQKVSKDHQDDVDQAFLMLYSGVQR